jgi:amino acid permease
MSRDDALITQVALCAALLSFILFMSNEVQIDRALMHGFLIFIFSYTLIYASYLFYHRVKIHLHRMEIEEQKRKVKEEKEQRKKEQPLTASERIGLPA